MVGGGAGVVAGGGAGVVTRHISQKAEHGSVVVAGAAGVVAGGEVVVSDFLNETALLLALVFVHSVLK